MLSRSRSHKHFRTTNNTQRRVNTVSYKNVKKALEATVTSLHAHTLGAAEQRALTHRERNRIFPDILYAHDITIAPQQQCNHGTSLSNGTCSEPEPNLLTVDRYNFEHTSLHRGISISLENLTGQVRGAECLETSQDTRTRKFSKIFTKFGTESTANPDLTAAHASSTKGLARQRSVSQDVSKQRHSYFTEQVNGVSAKCPPRNFSEDQLVSYDTNSKAKQDDKFLFKVPAPLSLAALRSTFSSPKPSNKIQATDAEKAQLFTEMNDCVMRDDSKRLRAIAKRKGVDINVANDEGTTLLHEAAYLGKLRCLRVLIKHGGIPNLLDSEAHTPLHAAVFGQELEAAEFLLENKAFADCPDLAGFTPLYYAVLIGHINMTALLLEHGANPLGGCEQRTSFQLAINLKRNVILNIMVILPSLQVASVVACDTDFSKQ